MKMFKIILFVLIIGIIGFSSFKVTLYYIEAKQRGKNPSATPIEEQRDQNKIKEIQVSSPVTTSTPPAKRTLSGIFEHNISADDPKSYMRWDFRTDGTVVYRLQAVGDMKVSDTVVQRTVEGNGKGLYTIQGDIVTANIILIGRTSLFPSYGVEPKISDPQTNEDIFRIDGDDLIHLSVAVLGEKTNTDNETRYIKRK